MTTWSTCPERPGEEAAVRGIVTAAFPATEEADLIDALRADPSAWVEGLSVVALDDEGHPAAHALLSRAHVGGEEVLASAPCATRPEVRRSGAGSAAIRAGLAAARDRGEYVVVVLGHPSYYPRFGFEPASRFGITVPVEAPDDAFLVLALDPGRPVPRGEVLYAPAFGK